MFLNGNVEIILYYYYKLDSKNYLNKENSIKISILKIRISHKS